MSGLGVWPWTRFHDQAPKPLKQGGALSHPAKEQKVQGGQKTTKTALRGAPGKPQKEKVRSFVFLANVNIHDMEKGFN